ncbi:MAG: iron-containing alcohol dehydrogenase [Sulfuricaulis sp.]
MFSIGNFSVSRLPRIVFGAGVFRQLPGIVAEHGKRLLIVTGSKSLRRSGRWQNLLRDLFAAGIGLQDIAVDGEPSPQFVDSVVSTYRAQGIDAVLGIGGGSVLDAAKAIAGLLPTGHSVMDYLEGVGRDAAYTGPAAPLIAVPTTAGTGSEATKNAVLSVQGVGGFKKSFRHDALVAQVALVDPELLASCPPELIAANGMDAFTQLLESYVSTRSNPFTDALAVTGMQAVRDGFYAAWRGGNSSSAVHGRACMAYAALLSGITLAQVGLGSVHGLASPIGAYYPVPHGVVCGTLLAAATAINIRALEERDPLSPALEKYAAMGRLLSETPARDDQVARSGLLRVLDEWTTRLGIPTLGTYGIDESGVGNIVAGSRGSSMKTNPIVLTDDEVADIVRARL